MSEDFFLSRGLRRDLHVALAEAVGLVKNEQPDLLRGQGPRVDQLLHPPCGQSKGGVSAVKCRERPEYVFFEICVAGEWGKRVASLRNEMRWAFTDTELFLKLEVTLVWMS